MLRTLPKSLAPWRRVPVSPCFMRLNSKIALPKLEDVQQEVKPEGVSESETDIPWYLRKDVTSDLLDTKEISLPEVPGNAPSQVGDFLNLLGREYGMENIELFDVSQLPDDHEFKENNQNVDYIIICSGKSEKHIYKAANELRTHLKHTYNTIPLIEGMVSSAKTPAMRRRLLRRAKKGPLATDNDYGCSANSWVMCNIEGVDMHMLTPERRDELNLELLWCKPEDISKYMPQEASQLESDSIFSGIRRFHTMSRFHRQQHLLEEYVYQVQSNPDMSDHEMIELKQKFKHAFENPTLKDYNVRFQMYKAMHLAHPEVVTFEEAENALLAKYASQWAFSKNMADQKLDDVTEYAKLLVDTPSGKKDKNLVDSALGKLSRFISVLYQFSNDSFSLSANPHFLPLLWRLCYIPNGLPQVSPKTVDNVIHQNHAIVVCLPAPSIKMASNSARNVLGLTDHFLDMKKSMPTHALDELILFTYGNACRWEKFWDHWEHMCFSRTVEPFVSVERLIRLAVYLSCRGDKTQMQRFLVNHWDNTDSIGGSFMQSFRANGEMFNSENEAFALRRAIGTMVECLTTGDKVPFEDIRKHVETMHVHN